MYCNWYSRKERPTGRILAFYFGQTPRMRSIYRCVVRGCDRVAVLMVYTGDVANGYIPLYQGKHTLHCFHQRFTQDEGIQNIQL